jgi:hypothetical protein
LGEDTRQYARAVLREVIRTRRDDNVEVAVVVSLTAPDGRLDAFRCDEETAANLVRSAPHGRSDCASTA